MIWLKNRMRDWTKERQRQVLLAEIDEMHEYISRCTRTQEALSECKKVANARLRVARKDLEILDNE